MLILGFVIMQEAVQFANAFTEITGAAAVVRASGAGATDRFTMGMVFVVKNVGIATAIAVTVLGRIEFAVLATVYFLAHVAVLLATVLVFRWMRVCDGNNLMGDDDT